MPAFFFSRSVFIEKERLYLVVEFHFFEPDPAPVVALLCEVLVTVGEDGLDPCKQIAVLNVCQAEQVAAIQRVIGKERSSSAVMQKHTAPAAAASRGTRSLPGWWPKSM